VQIMKRHWPALSPFSRKSGLNLGQRSFHCRVAPGSAMPSAWP
jgi:hypothetical protein